MTEAEEGGEESECCSGCHREPPPNLIFHGEGLHCIEVIASCWGGVSKLRSFMPNQRDATEEGRTRPACWEAPTPQRLSEGPRGGEGARC